MSNKIDDSLFEDVPYQEPSSDLFEDVPYQVEPQEDTSEVSVSQEDSPDIDLTPSNPLSVFSGKALESLPNPVPLIDKGAENLAYIGIGGRSTSPGLDLIKEQARSNYNVIDPTVTPNKIGRQVLDEGILGKFGLGTKDGNLKRANDALYEASKPTNELLQSLPGNIPKQDILRRTEQILDIPNLDMAIPENKLVAKNLTKRVDDFQGTYSPLEAEKTKRELQKSINYGNDKSAAKATVSKAQARATREAVENAALLEGKLEEFRKYKGKSGNIATAADIIESSIKPEVIKPTGVLSQSLDFLKSKASSVGATGLDSLSSGLKTAGKVLKPVVGVLPYVGAAAGAISGYAEAKEEGFGPKASAAYSALEAINPLPISGISAYKNIQESSKGRASNISKNYDISKEDLVKVKEEDKIKNLEDLYNKFKSMTNSKGGEAISPILESAISGTPEEKAKAEFQINQNPWLRNKVNKS